MEKSLFLSILNKISRFLSNSNKSLGKIPGLIKVSDLLYKIAYNRANKEGLLLIEVQKKEMYVHLNDKGLTPSLVRTGIFEEYETKVFKNLIKNDTTLIDIGANIGYYTLIATDMIKNGIIYSFEPEILNYYVLNKNIDLNNIKNVITLQKAVSNDNGEIKIYLDEKNLGNHSLAKKNVPDEKNFIKVETITLDSFFADMDRTITDNIVLKMDTQGAEGLIIEGSQKFLLRNNIQIMMEFWPKGLRNMGTDPLDLLNKLENYGFEIRLIDEKTRSLKNMHKNDIIDFCDDPYGVRDQLNLLIEKGN